MWGCLTKVVALDPKRIKKDKKLLIAHLLVMKLIVVHIDFYIHVNIIIESRNAYFFEDIFLNKKVVDSSSCKRTYDTASSSPQNNIKNEYIEKDDDLEPRHNQKTKISKSFGLDFLTYMLESEPKNFAEAVSTPEAPFWKEAINSEIESIMKNHTRELVDLPPGCKPLGWK